MASEYILSRDVTPIFQVSNSFNNKKEYFLIGTYTFIVIISQIFSRDANNELVNHPELEELLQQPENALVWKITILLHFFDTKFSG